MNEKGVKCEKMTLVLLFLTLAAASLLVGMVTAVQGAEVVGVTRYIPTGLAAGEEFEVTLMISGERPMAAGIVETIPVGFSFVSTTHPTDHYNVSGQKIAFAAINTTEIRYTVMTPSSSEGTFTGEWIDLLSDKEGEIADTTVIVDGGSAGAIEEVTVTATPAPTPTATVAASPATSPASKTPGFRAIFTVAVSLLVVYTLMVKKKVKGGDDE